jgi:hypothetical protein
VGGGGGEVQIVFDYSKARRTPGGRGVDMENDST